MKFFTNKSVIQKIVIALVIVISFNFSMPVKVQADAGGIFVSPLVALVTVIFDQIQHLMEWAMLGETNSIIKESSSDANMDGEVADGAIINIAELSGEGKTLKFDGEIWGLGDYGYPRLSYTPEEIFSNRVPALDINFINPSVNGGNESKHIASKIQNVIASWYVAIRTISIVGLLSVLVYLGIRMMLTSIAADRAKYKQMLMDWVVAMCLIFALHYIMSFALTLSETVTAMISSDLGKTVTVVVPDGNQFNTNLMGFVRFMIQCTDLQQKLTFLVLYIMLEIFTIRFTWVYLKRVVNMAFLTLFAPFVALTYPIDKVSDGKAQAFDMWIKEFSFNALLQPLHLLIYTVLVGSALHLAVNNPLYAIVCLGFILSAEKLLKQMFGFGKAKGGTLGSLAGAAGVTAVAGKMLNTIGQKGPAGGKGKIRTKDNIGERQGKDAGANKPFAAFANKDASQVIGAGAAGGEEGTSGNRRDSSGGPQDEGSGTNTPTQENNNNGEMNQLEQQLDAYNETDPYFMDPEHQEMQRKYQELREQNQDNEVPAPPSEENESEELKTPEEKGFFRTVGDDIAAFGGRLGEGANNLKNNMTSGEAWKGLGQKAVKGVRRRAIGAWKALPTVGYKAARGTLRTASRVALAGAMGGLGLAIGATTGDGDKALSMALGAAGVGFASGDNIFDASVGQVMRDKSISDAYGAGKYGNAIDARNAKADKEYERTKFDQFYEKYYKGKQNKFDGKNYTKKEILEATRSYRKAGITNETDIRRAIGLEETYKKNAKKNNINLSAEDARAQVQNIVQSYKDMDIDKKAYSDDKVREKEINRIAGMLGGASDNNNKMAGIIFQGYEDWRNSAV